MIDQYGPPENITLQTVFDKVAKHLLRQGYPSINPALLDDELEGQACAYRGEHRSACAIGCLIPEDRYDESYENVSINGLSFGDYETDATVLLPIKLKEDDDLLEMMHDLQVVHDNAALKDDGSFDLLKLRGHLRRVASRFKIDPTFTYWRPDLPEDWDGGLEVKL